MSSRSSAGFASTVARGRRADEFATPAKLARWLEHRGLLDAGIDLGEAEQQSAFDLRRGLRALILANSGVEGDVEALERFEEVAARGRFSLRFESSVPIGFGPASRNFEDALAGIAGIVTFAKLEGVWPKLKICAEGDCGRAFFDTSPNHTGRWCSTRCGEKYRAAIARRRDRRG